MHRSRLSNILIDCAEGDFASGVEFWSQTLVEAEVQRLEKLRARVKSRISNRVVMLAPSGHAFRVVPARRSDFPGKAPAWD